MASVSDADTLDAKAMTHAACADRERASEASMTGVRNHAWL